MNLSGLIMETSTVHSTKSARPLSIVKFVFLCDNELNRLFKLSARARYPFVLRLVMTQLLITKVA